MPRVHRKIKHRAASYDEGHVYQLRTGHDMLDGAFGSHPNTDFAAAREAWDLLGERILTDWIAERPGTRPWAWWQFNSPAPHRRERIDGGVHPFDNKERATRVAKSDNPDHWARAYRLHFGLPSTIIQPTDKDIYRDCAANGFWLNAKSHIFESERTYLERHGLLLPEEKRCQK